LIPILQVLRETGFDKSTLPDLFPLITSDRNYSCYIKAYEEAPSVSFYPLTSDSSDAAKRKVFLEIYASLTYKHPSASKTAQNSEKQDSHDEKWLSWFPWT